MNYLRSFVFVLLVSTLGLGQTPEYPGKSWQQYKTPEEAGFSSEKLETVEKRFDESDAAALLVIYRGQVLFSRGETDRRFRCASMRKSLMNALYGIYVDKGKIDLDATLAQLGIDDNPPLTPEEKQAKVRHLLSSTSGIYHAAAYSPQGMEENLPARGSHPPGTFWYYNNWDFNTLSTIFEKETGKKVFKVFTEKIARPLQMEDFRPDWDTHYRFEPEESQHPAYLFRMTARDLARFGLLYLNEGRWQNKQIIPADWIKESTASKATADAGFTHRGSYGYLWWISEEIGGQPMYFASGSGGQKICVLPNAELVVVHLVNTYDNNSVRHPQFLQMVTSILNAREQEPKLDPKLIAYVPSERPTIKPIVISDETLQKYAGTYQHRILGEFKFVHSDAMLIVETKIGKFRLLPISESQFIPEDIETPLQFEVAPDDDLRGKIVSVYNENKKLDHIVCYY